MTSLCKLLGKEDDETQRALQCLSSTISMDFSALILNDASQGGQSEEDSSPEAEQPPNIPQQNGDVMRQSDSESGFEDGGSFMSKSLQDNMVPPVSKQDSIEGLAPENLLKELQSVAVEWKSFRNVKHCGCAMPFEHFNKKVGTT